MATRSRHILIIALIAGLLLSGGAFAYWKLLVQGPFAGETTHDFGDVPLFSETEKLDHAFHLTNRLSHPLTIVAVRPECGCLTVRDVRRTLQPGESFDLPVTLVARAGKREVPIDVAFEDGSMTTLRVRAFGRLQSVMRFDPSGFSPKDDGQVDIAFQLWTYDTHDDPLAPSITTVGDDVHAEFAGWTMYDRPKPKYIAEMPTQWVGHIRVRTGDGTKPEGTVTVNLPPLRPLTIDLAAQAGPSASQPAISAIDQ